MAVTVSSKGQMVIPVAVRERYHITSGSRVEVLDTGQEIVLVPVPKNAFRASRGMLRGYSVREFLRWRKEERRREHARLRWTGGCLSAGFLRHPGLSSQRA